MKDRYQIRWLREGDASDVTTVFGEDGATVAYFYTGNNGKPSMLTYVGKRGKENSRYYYVDEKQRQAALTRFIEGVVYRQEQKEAAVAERKSSTTKLNVGDVVYTSWGYDQTNIDYFMITEISKTKKSVKVSKMTQAIRQATGPDSADVVPTLDTLDPGGRWFRTWGDYNVTNVDGSHTGYPWDGKPNYSSWGH